jgi:hypothetical protein
MLSPFEAAWNLIRKNLGMPGEGQQLDASLAAARQQPPDASLNLERVQQQPWDNQAANPSVPPGQSTLPQNLIDSAPPPQWQQPS